MMSEIKLGVLRMTENPFWSDQPITRFQHDAIMLEAAEVIEQLQQHSKALQARIGRLEEAAQMAILRNPYCDRLEEVLNETEQQGLSEIQAEAVERFAKDTAETGQLGGGDVSWFKEWAKEWVDQQGKDHD